MPSATDTSWPSTSCFFRCILLLPLLFQSPCLEKPCEYGGSCVANYDDDTYKCLCEAGFTGKNCQTSKSTSDILFHLYTPSLHFAMIAIGFPSEEDDGEEDLKTFSLL